MRYLIWGTGRKSKYMLEELSGYFKKNIITAFIDSDLKKCGKNFYNHVVISPEEIKDKEFDFIIIASTFKNEIIKKIFNIGIDINKILTKEDLIQKIVDYYCLKYDIFNKRILCITNNKELLPSDVFKIIGTVDIKNLNYIKNYKYDYIFIQNIKRLIDKDATEDEFIKELISKYGVEPQKIISSDFCISFRYYLCKKSLGKENPDKTFFVIKLSARNGLAAQIYSVKYGVEYAKSKGYIPIVDGQYAKNMYMDEGEYGSINSWEKFFVQPYNYTMNDIINSKNVIYSEGVNRNAPYDDNFFENLKMSSILQRECDEFIKNIKFKERKILGVLFRGTDYANLKPYGHYVQPDLKKMLEVVKIKLNEWKLEYIFLCTEVQEAVDIFISEFGNKVIYINQERVQQNFNGYLDDYIYNDNGYRRGADYFIAIMTLSKCNSLVAGKCSGSLLACDLNAGKYEHTYLFDYGFYGMNN